MYQNKMLILLENSHYKIWAIFITHDLLTDETYA